MSRIAEFLELKPHAVVVLAGVFLALLGGSLIRVVSVWLVPAHQRQQRLASLKTWWVLGFLFACSVLLGRAAATLFFAVSSYLALREFLDLTVPDRRERHELRFIFLAVPLHYVCVYVGGFPAAWLVTPLVFSLLLAVRLVLRDTPDAFIRRISVPSWGLLLLVFFPSHAPLLYSLPESANPVGGSAGWFLYLVLLTEICDIAQALWGRAVGRHKMTPQVSPNKTWEGFLLGTLSTVVLAVAGAAWLTPLAHAASDARPLTRLAALLPATLAGLLIAVSALLGDLTMSAVKRDAGVKDSGALLPGIGGMLDRIDSLTFTAPVFFYYVAWLYSGSLDTAVY